MVNSNSDIKLKAEELVEQYGEKAIEVAKRKVDAFPKDEHHREKDSALMLLTEVEKLLEVKN